MRMLAPLGNDNMGMPTAPGNNPDPLSLLEADSDSSCGSQRQAGVARVHGYAARFAHKRHCAHQPQPLLGDIACIVQTPLY